LRERPLSLALVVSRKTLSIKDEEREREREREREKEREVVEHARVTLREKAHKL